MRELSSSMRTAIFRNARRRVSNVTAGQLERRIETQSIKVVAILIAAGNGEHPRPDHVGVAIQSAIASRTSGVLVAIGKPSSGMIVVNTSSPPVAKKSVVTTASIS